MKKTRSVSEFWDESEIHSLIVQVHEAGGQIPAVFFPLDDLRDEKESSAEDSIPRDRAWTGLSISIFYAVRNYNQYAFQRSSYKSRRIKKLDKIETQVQRMITILDEDDLILKREIQFGLHEETSKASEFGVNHAILAIASAMQLGDPYRALLGLDLDELIMNLKSLHEALKRSRTQLVGSSVSYSNKWSPQIALYMSLSNTYKFFLNADPDETTIKTRKNYHGPFPAFVRGCLHLAEIDPGTDEAFTEGLVRYFKAMRKMNSDHKN